MQIQLPTLRAAPRFRPSVLGTDLRSKIAELPEATREHLLAEIASESGVDGMDLATQLAKTDPSPKVQAEVVQYLQFRRADRHVASLLAEARDETWALVARAGYADEIRDPATARRLGTERDKALAQAVDPVERLRLLIDQSPTYPNRDAGIAAAIADAHFPVRDQHAGTSLYYAKQRAPAAVLQGLRRRLEAGLDLPFHADDLLNQMEVTDEGPIAAAILDVRQDNRDVNAAAVMAGPKTVEALVGRYLACAQALRAKHNDHILSDEYYRLRTRIAATRAQSFVPAVMVHSNTDDPARIASLAALIFLHGNGDDRKLSISIEPTFRPQLIETLRNWVEVVVSAPNGDRYQLNEISNAIGRFGFCELLPEMKRLLDEDSRA